MSYSTQTVHEVIGMSVSEVHKTQSTDYQCVTFFYKDKSKHHMTVFYEPGAETITPREYPTKPAMTVFTEDSKICQAQKDSFANALPNPIIGEYNKDDYPKDYIV